LSLGFALLAAVLPMRGQVDGEPPTNLAVFQRLSFEIGSDLKIRTGGMKPEAVTLFPREIGLLLEKELMRGLGGSGTTATEGDSALLRVEFAVTDARVVLEGARRDGFFGARVVERVVVLAGRAKSTGGGKLEYYDVARSLRDTVLMSGVERLSSQAIPFTRMTIPSQGFFDDILEPLVVLGSVGVAVYLLFAVRS
jgi:hypothetical protein